MKILTSPDDKDTFTMSGSSKNLCNGGVVLGEYSDGRYRCQGTTARTVMVANDNGSPGTTACPYNGKISFDRIYGFSKFRSGIANAFSNADITASGIPANAYISGASG